MFLNFTNHPSSNWTKKQLQEAQKYGEIVDLPFPQVEPEYTKDIVYDLAEKFAKQIIKQKPDCVLCQGEFCLSFCVIEKLKKYGIKVVAACSKREVEEIVIDTETRKNSRFVFVQFREY